MRPLSPRFTYDEHGTLVEITLTADDWRSILEELEELDDIRAFDEAIASGETAVPLAQAIAEMERNRR